MKPTGRLAVATGLSCLLAAGSAWACVTAKTSPSPDIAPFLATSGLILAPRIGGLKEVAVSAVTDAKAPQPAYIEACRAAAHAKLESQAKSYGIKVDMATLRVTGTDDRPGNPSKYVWWSVDVTDRNGRDDLFPAGKPFVLTKLTQKYRDEPCF